MIGLAPIMKFQKMPTRSPDGTFQATCASHCPNARRKPSEEQIEIDGARLHNLKKVDVKIPLAMIVAITGVSGSGKSTLLHDVLYRASQRPSDNSSATPSRRGLGPPRGRGPHRRNVLVDQSPIGRTPRSSPVTYIKAFEGIRDRFASLPDSKKRGSTLDISPLTFPGGAAKLAGRRNGDGGNAILADVGLMCEECKGTRYKPQVLDVRYRGKNIHEVLDLSVKEALQFFANPKIVKDKLRVLEEVGLGYLRLGQSATTLSGGEAQRMKLAAHLQPSSHDSGYAL